MGVLKHGGLLSLDLVLTPVQVLEPLPDQAGVNALVLAGIPGRVDPAHRGPESRRDQLADSGDSVREVADQEAEVPIVLRLVAEELDRHFSDEAQRALAADNDVADVRARGPSGHVL